MDLLNLLTSTYFHYKQLHGTAMGNSVSVVVAEIVMQNIKEQALLISELYLFGYATLKTDSPLYTKTKSTIFTNTLRDRTWTYSLPRRSRKIVKYLF